MTASSHADELDRAADVIADMSRAELQIMLRRAALRLRNGDRLTLDEHVDAALADVMVATGMGRNEMLRLIVKEWLEKNGYLDLADQK